MLELVSCLLICQTCFRYVYTYDKPKKDHDSEDEESSDEEDEDKGEYHQLYSLQLGC